MKKPIETAPKDGTKILAYCKSEVDLTDDYSVACDCMPHAPKGWHVVRYIEGYWEQDNWDNERYLVGGHWSLTGDETIWANPVEWVELPCER